MLSELFISKSAAPPILDILSLAVHFHFPSPSGILFAIPIVATAIIVADAPLSPLTFLLCYHHYGCNCCCHPLCCRQSLWLLLLPAEFPQPLMLLPPRTKPQCDNSFFYIAPSNLDQYWAIFTMDKCGKSLPIHDANLSMMRYGGVFCHLRH